MGGDPIVQQKGYVLPVQFGKDYPVIVRGEGVYVFDKDNTRYLDAIGGVCVVNIGHGVNEIVDAMAEQARTLAYSYGGYVENNPRLELAHKSQEWAPAGMG
jgi:adenosylmethionine-8-amino-7-oxononanoate aminotransferase